jgi:phosphatidate cytidylyltransferase
MTGSFVPLPTLDLVASLGGVLAVAGLAYRLASPGVTAGAWRGGAALRAAADVVALIGAAGAFWLGGDALIVLFAAVSALAIRDFAGASDRAGRALAACYACVPLQFGALAAGRLDVALVAMPILAALVLPLVALTQGGTRDFVARASEQCWCVLAWVYCLSFVPALLLLEGPAFEDRNAGLVAFVVAISLAAQTMPTWSIRTSRGLAWAARALAMLVLGAALAWMTPFSPSLAAVLALATAIPGGFGVFVMAAMRNDRSPRMRDAGVSEQLAVRPDALAFAGPLFFFAMRVFLP